MNPLAEMLVVGTFWFWVLILVEFCLLIWCLEYEKYIVAPATVVALAAVLILFGTGVREIGDWILANKLWTALYAGLYVVIGTVYAVIKWYLFVHDIRDVNRDRKREWLADWQKNVQRNEHLVATGKASIEQAQKDISEWERQLPIARERGDRDKIRELEYRQSQTQSQLEQATKQVADAEAALAAWSASNGALTADLLPLWKEYERSTYHRDWFGRSILIVKPEPEEFKGRIIAWVGYWPPSMAWTILNDPLRRIGRSVYNAISKLLKRISDSAWKDEDNVA